MVDLLLKYRDYQIAITLVEQLDKKKLLSQIYEEWCATLLMHTKQSEKPIIDLFKRKFTSLAEKLALDQGVSYSIVEQYKRKNAINEL